MAVPFFHPSGVMLAPSGSTFHGSGIVLHPLQTSGSIPITGTAKFVPGVGSNVAYALGNLLKGASEQGSSGGH